MNQILFSPKQYSFQLLTVLLLLTGILTACSGASAPLNGTVVDAYTGQPVPEAEVAVGRTTLETDPNGVFNTVRWSAEDTLEVTAPGYETTTIPLESQPEVDATSTTTVTLETMLRPNTVSGTITDAYTDAPLEGVQVSVALDETQTVSTTTNAEGGYVLEGLPEEFTLSVNAPEYGAVQEDVSRTTDFSAELRPAFLSGTVTDNYSGEPVADATVTAGEATATTDADGNYRLEGLASDATDVEISADGYATVRQELAETTELDAVLRPDELAAALIDQESGEPVQNAAIIATTELPGESVAFTRIENSTDGAFTLEGLPEEGYVQVIAPGYRKAVLELEEGNVPTEIALEPFAAKALYVTAAVGSSPSLLAEYMDIIDRTELNAIVLDLKSDMRDDLGVVYYDSQVPLVQELGTSVDSIDMPGFLAEAKKRGIYTIARVQIFSHDNALADARPEWAIQDLENGGVFADLPGPNIRYAWLDPWNRNVWNYNIQLSLEAIEMGFDEVNFDYIRFPDFYGDPADYNKELGFSEPTDPVNNQDAMYDNIAEFMKTSRAAINGSGAFFSVDVFGRALVAPARMVSQDIGRMANHADYICPMPYPSLWWGGYLGFENPTAHPYEVIYQSLESGQEFVEGKYGLLRPWLQDHTDPWQGARVVEYGPAEVRAQIDATEDFGKASGWLLYDSANTYTEAALEPAE